MKKHLAKIGGDIKKCSKVSYDVEKQMEGLLKEIQKSKTSKRKVSFNEEGTNECEDAIDEAIAQEEQETPNADDKPSLGIIYEGMLRSENGIKEMFKHRKSAYQPYTGIINSRWDKHLKKNLHVVVYFLNPDCFFSENYRESPDVMRALLDLVTLHCKVNNLDSVEAMKEIQLYRDRKESFDRPEAIKVVVVVVLVHFMLHHLLFLVQVVKMKVMKSMTQICSKLWRILMIDDKLGSF
ncbi:hypothetical protein Ahy_A10g050121 [Arachis hypogaea]|uniref:Uncharacterized protein n=1 Tax=Arachis hypogaea TaxID=3818 RepID=A0A445B8P4_ARAHY|nr:hypothetical protein Ahy_A10g050121 [Arachis hypogaea]